MIRTQKIQDLDRQIYVITKRFPPFWGGEHWKFLTTLRYEEYHANQKAVYHKILKKIWYMIYRHYGVKMSRDIPINVFRPGFKINHFGLMVVNDNVRIGAFCDNYQGVNIIHQGDLADDVSTIDDNVWIDLSAKLFWEILGFNI